MSPLFLRHPCTRTESKRSLAIITLEVVIRSVAAAAMITIVPIPLSSIEDDDLLRRVAAEASMEPYLCPRWDSLSSSLAMGNAEANKMPLKSHCQNHRHSQLGFVVNKNGQSENLTTLSKPSHPPPPPSRDKKPRRPLNALRLCLWGRLFRRWTTVGIVRSRKRAKKNQSRNFINFDLVKWLVPSRHSRWRAVGRTLLANIKDIKSWKHLPLWRCALAGDETTLLPVAEWERLADQTIWRFSLQEARVACEAQLLVGAFLLYLQCDSQESEKRLVRGATRKYGASEALFAVRSGVLCFFLFPNAARYFVSVQNCCLCSSRNYHGGSVPSVSCAISNQVSRASPTPVLLKTYANMVAASC